MSANLELENTYNRAMRMPDRVAAAQKKLNPVYDELIVKVPAAIKDGDREMIEFYLKAIRVELNSISGAIQDVTIGINEFNEIEDDEEFLDGHLKEVEEATKKLTDAQKKLTEQYEKIKALENDAEKGFKSRKVSKDDMFTEVARYDKWVTQDLRTMDDVIRESYPIISKADEAMDARDAAALAEAQKKMSELALDELIDGLQSHENGLKALLKTIEDQKFDAKDTADLKDAVNDLLGDRLGKARPGVRELQQTKERIRGLKITPINVDDAMDTLGLDSKDAKVKAKLAAVFKGRAQDFEKGLDKLAKELRLKTNGKAMLAELKKSWSR